MKMSLLLIHNLTLGLNDQPQHQTQLADEAFQTVRIIISSVITLAGVWLRVEQCTCSAWCCDTMHVKQRRVSARKRVGLIAMVYQVTDVFDMSALPYLCARIEWFPRPGIVKV